jgi:formylglycine-generating enzyme required for sulfatase activity
MANIADASLKGKLDADYVKQLMDQKWEFQSWDDGYPFTAPVGSFPPNAWGLHDMHGNVCQWCADWFGKTYYGNSPVKDPKGPDSGKDRVRRCGSWNHLPRYCRSACRFHSEPGDCNSNCGFRVVLRGP